MSINYNKIAKEMRIDILKMALEAKENGAHMGGSLSLVEIMIALYCKVMKFNPKKPDDEVRDRLIFSKGHGVMAQYAVFKQIGLLTTNDLMNFKSNETKLYAHPSINIQKGIEFSSGSLGQGLSLAVGTALGLIRKENTKSKVFVILGDGECNEGSIWEAAASASHFALNNIVVIVDKNNLQYDGTTNDVLSFGSLEEKWKSFDWDVCTVDGHNTNEVIEALQTSTEKPLAIIAETIKGKGISFMENIPSWHSGIVTQALFDKALQELEATND